MEAHVIPYGPTWTHMAPYGPIWPDMGGNVIDPWAFAIIPRVVLKMGDISANRIGIQQLTESKSTGIFHLATFYHIWPLWPHIITYDIIRPRCGPMWPHVAPWRPYCKMLHHITPAGPI